MLAGIIERAQLEPRTEFYLAITLPGDEQEVVGFARLGPDGVKAGKFGYALTPSAQGHVYAIDACRALTGFGFAPDAQAARLVHQPVPVCSPRPVHSSSDFVAIGGRPVCSWQATRNSLVRP